MKDSFAKNATVMDWEQFARMEFHPQLWCAAHTWHHSSTAGVQKANEMNFCSFIVMIFDTIVIHFD